MSKRTSCKYLQVHIGEELESKLKAPNNYSSYAIMVLAKEKKRQNEKQAKNRIKSGLQLVMFQILLWKYCFQL